MIVWISRRRRESAAGAVSSSGEASIELDRTAGRVEPDVAAKLLHQPARRFRTHSLSQGTAGWPSWGDSKLAAYVSLLILGDATRRSITSPRESTISRKTNRMKNTRLGAWAPVANPLASSLSRRLLAASGESIGPPFFIFPTLHQFFPPFNREHHGARTVATRATSGVARGKAGASLSYAPAAKSST